MTRSATNRPFSLLGRLPRLVAGLAMLAALLAAFVSTPIAPAARADAQAQAQTADVTIQVYTCPDNYAGAEYLTDCSPGPVGVEVLFTDDVDNTAAPGTVTSITDLTDADGFASQAFPAGETLAVVQLSPDSFDFYHACFDTTSGSEVYQFDGDTNGATFTTAAGGSTSCRFYVIPTADELPAPTTAAAAFQVFECELADVDTVDLDTCVEGPAGVPVQVSAEGYSQENLTSDIGVAVNTTIPPGLVTITLDPDEVVYPNGQFGTAIECFDLTSGTRVSLGESNVGTIDLEVVANGDYACDFYVTPQGDVTPDTASAAFQVFTCPEEYEGDDFLTDCAPNDDANPVDVLLFPGPVVDIELPYDELTTDDDGRVVFTDLEAGNYSAALDVSERVNSFYFACFDVTSGSEVFLFDGGGVQLNDFALAAGGALSCRWYVIPQELPGASASASASAPASVAASAKASASAPAGPVTGLPSTGTGAGGGELLPMMALAAAALAALAGASLITRRLATARM